MEPDNWIKKLRLDRNWTQQQMAEYLGIDRSSVTRLEGGQQPHGSTMRLLEQLRAETEAAA